MEIKKAGETFDVYQAKLSYLELTVLADALRDGGEGIVADELRRSIEWHIDRLPGPGEDKDDNKDDKKDEEDDHGLPAPPSDEETPPSDEEPASSPSPSSEVAAAADEHLPAPETV